MVSTDESIASPTRGGWHGRIVVKELLGELSVEHVPPTEDRFPGYVKRFTVAPTAPLLEAGGAAAPAPRCRSSPMMRKGSAGIMKSLQRIVISWSDCLPLSAVAAALKYQTDRLSTDPVDNAHAQRIDRVSMVIDSAEPIRVFKSWSVDPLQSAKSPSSVRLTVRPACVDRFRRLVDRVI